MLFNDILKRYKYNINSEFPLKLETNNGDFVSGNIAKDILSNIKEDYEKVNNFIYDIIDISKKYNLTLYTNAPNFIVEDYDEDSIRKLKDYERGIDEDY
jgi:hypothetical protein